MKDKDIIAAMNAITEEDMDKALAELNTAATASLLKDLEEGT